MSRVSASIVIAAPPERVWDVVMDPDRLEQWVTIHRRSERVSEHPLAKGSTLEQTLCLRGVNFKVRWTVVESRPPALAVWEGKGPARSRAHTTYRLADDGGGGTRFVYETEFAAPFGLLGAAASRALVGGIPQREAKESLCALKRLLEP